MGIEFHSGDYMDIYIYICSATFGFAYASIRILLTDDGPGVDSLFDRVLDRFSRARGPLLQHCRGDVWYAHIHDNLDRIRGHHAFGVETPPPLSFDKVSSTKHRTAASRRCVRRTLRDQSLCRPQDADIGVLVYFRCCLRM